MKLTYRTPDRRLPDDVEYFISSAVECHDLPCDVAFWSHYMCPQIGQLINADVEGPLSRQHPEDRYVNTGTALLRIRKAYDKWFNNPRVNNEYKMLCLAVGASGIRIALRDAARSIADFTVQEMNEHNLPTIHDPNSKIVRKFKARKITENGGHAEIFLRQWKDESLLQEQTTGRIITDIKALLARIDGLGELPDEASIIVTPTQKLAWRKYGRLERKAIRRGIEVLSEVIGEDEALRFIAARHIEIPAEKFSFRLKLEHLAESHGGVSTEVLVKGEPICKLCIYIPGTAILDHVVSVIWHVQNGLEDRLIEIGNPYSINHERGPTGIPVLDNRLKLVDRVTNPRREPIVVRSVRPPRLIRIGDSPFTKKMQEKVMHRVVGYLHREVFGSKIMPKPKVLFSYPNRIDQAMEFQIPPAFIIRTLEHVRVQVLEQFDPQLAQPESSNL